MIYNLARFAYTRSYSHVWLALTLAAMLCCAVANLGLLATWAPRLVYSQPLIADLSTLAGCVALLGFTIAFFHQRSRPWCNWLLAYRSTSAWRWQARSCLAPGCGTSG